MVFIFTIFIQIIKIIIQFIVILL